MTVSIMASTRLDSRQSKMRVPLLILLLDLGDETRLSDTEKDEENCQSLFDALAEVDSTLSHQTFLVGETFTEADVVYISFVLKY